MATKLDPISIEILWARLLGLVDQAAVTLMRTAFSGVVRDSHDFACVLCDEAGRMVAQDTRGTPGLAGTMPFLMRSFLEAYPRDTFWEGDVLLTNDPWHASGHLLDLSIGTPIFHRGRLVAFALCCAHHIDIGGRKATTESREVFEEGLHIPFCKLYERGVENDLIVRVLRANVRLPDLVVGDLRAQVAANDLLVQRVRELLEDESLDDLQDLSEQILRRTEAATRAAIRRIPPGRYESTTMIDRRIGRGGQLGEPIRIQVAVIVEGDRVVLDFAGSSPQVEAAINCTLYGINHSHALLAIKSLLDPSIPSNDGYVGAIEVRAPEGSILNARFPASVYARAEIAHFIPETVYQALAPVLPERVIAGSGSTPSWIESFSGTRQDGRPFGAYVLARGGLGARPERDGVSCIAFPSNSASLPVEVLEADVPVICESKQLIPDSAGPGRFRGGLGQEVAIRVLEGELAPLGPIVCGTRGGRFDYNVPGILGGQPAGRGEILHNGQPIRSGRQLLLEPGDRLVFRVPGGGGLGPPRDRERWRVALDVRDGYVSSDQAAGAYGATLEDLEVVEQRKQG